MKWTVRVHRRVEKTFPRLPEKIRDALITLMREIELTGPVRYNWPNYGWMKDRKMHHCHLKKGRPTYVACWQADRLEITVEVIYAGTHEKAPY